MVAKRKGKNLNINDISKPKTEYHIASIFMYRKKMFVVHFILLFDRIKTKFNMAFAIIL